MALSDVCFEFLNTIQAASAELAREVDWYGAPDYPIPYGDEIAALRDACERVAKDTLDADSMSQLVQLAYSVMVFHDTPPFTKESNEREARMKTLIKIFQTNLSVEDASLAENAVAEITRDDDSVEKSARVLNKILKRLGKSTYDVAIRVISDIASETAKKFFDFK